MSDCYVNIRFGTRHFKIHKDGYRLSFNVNPYHIGNPDSKWFAIYQFPGLTSWINN